MARADLPSSAIGPRADAATRAVLDAADGIERVMGDRALYGRMLRRFRDDYQEGAILIRNAIGGGDGALAQRIAHTLKGAAGMISAPVVYLYAGELEFTLRKAPAGEHAAIARLEGALADVLLAIEQLLLHEPAADQPALAPSPPVAPDHDLVAQLARLLASGDGAAVDLLEDSGASLKAMLGEAQFDQVAVATNEFDFDRALAALRWDIEGK